MATEITYEVHKRPAGTDETFEHHIDRLGMFIPDEGEPATFDSLDEAYKAAERLGPAFDTTIRVVETTVHTYFL